MTLLAQLQAAGLPVTGVALGAALTQGGQLGPHEGRALTEFTTGEEVPVLPATLTWSSGPTPAQENAARAILGGAYILAGDARAEGGGEPPGPTDPLFAQVTHLFSYDGLSLVNAGSGLKGTLRGAATLSETQKKFGDRSLFVNGSDHALGVGGLALGSGDWTVEGWAFCTEFSATFFRSILGNFNGGVANSWSIFVTDTPQTYLSFNVASGPAVTGTTSIEVNTWFHFAVSRVGSTVYVFLNGVLQGSGSVAGITFASTEVLVGWNQTLSGVDRWPGYIDDLRVTIGTGRYTTSFTPPTEAYPAG